MCDVYEDVCWKLGPILNKTSDLFCGMKIQRGVIHEPRGSFLELLTPLSSLVNQITKYGTIQKLDM